MAITWQRPALQLVKDNEVNCTPLPTPFQNILSIYYNMGGEAGGPCSKVMGGEEGLLQSNYKAIYCIFTFLI